MLLMPFEKGGSRKRHRLCPFNPTKAGGTGLKGQTLSKRQGQGGQNSLPESLAHPFDEIKGRLG